MFCSKFFRVLDFHFNKKIFTRGKNSPTHFHDPTLFKISWETHGSVLVLASHEKIFMLHRTVLNLKLLRFFLLFRININVAFHSIRYNKLRAYCDPGNMDFNH